MLLDNVTRKAFHVYVFYIKILVEFIIYSISLLCIRFVMKSVVYWSLVPPRGGSCLNFIQSRHLNIVSVSFITDEIKF